MPNNMPNNMPNKDTHVRSYPQDIAACHAMLDGLFESMAEHRKRIAQLEEIVEQLIHEEQSRKSERYDP